MSPFLIKVCNRIGFLPYLYTSFKKKILGKEFIIPVINKLGYNNLYLSEPWMTNLLQKLKPLFNGYFTDIGVNTGQTLLKVYAVYGKVNYTGFEPNPICINYVQELVKRNKLTNCNIIPIGVGKSTDLLKLHFYIDNASDPSASIIENFREGEVAKHSIYIPVFNSDHLLQLLPNEQNTLVKIDVEGAETEVLEGLENWIRASQPILLMEILPVYSTDHKERLERQVKLERLLKQMKYLTFRISKSDAIQLLPLKEIGIHGNIEDCEYLFCPEHISEKLLQCFGQVLDSNILVNH